MKLEFEKVLLPFMCVCGVVYLAIIPWIRVSSNDINNKGGGKQ